MQCLASSACATPSIWPRRVAQSSNGKSFAQLVVNGIEDARHREERGKRIDVVQMSLVRRRRCWVGQQLVSRRGRVDRIVFAAERFGNAQAHEVRHRAVEVIVDEQIELRYRMLPLGNVEVSN